MSVNDKSDSPKPVDSQASDKNPKDKIPAGETGDEKVSGTHTPDALDAPKDQPDVDGIPDIVGEPAQDILKSDDHAFEEAAADPVDGLPPKTKSGTEALIEDADSKVVGPKKSSVGSIITATLFVGVVGAAILSWDQWKGYITDTKPTPPPADVSAPPAPTPVPEPAPAEAQGENKGEQNNAEATEAAPLDNQPEVTQIIPTAPQSPPSAPPAPAPNQTTEAELKRLQAALDAANARIQELESRPVTDLAPLNAALAAASAQIKALEERPQLPAALPQQVETLKTELAEHRRLSADAASVLRLNDRVEKSESLLRDLEARRSSAATLLLATNQLRDAISRALPYDGEWRALSVMANQDQEILTHLAVLQNRAQTGIPSLLTLQKRFDSLTAAALRADILPENQGWWRDTLGRITSLVMIRREDGSAQGTETPAVIARMSDAVAAQNLALALQESKSLSAAAAQSLAPWLQDVTDRLAADRALSSLTAHALALAGAKQ